MLPTGNPPLLPSRETRGRILEDSTNTPPPTKRTIPTSLPIQATYFRIRTRTPSQISHTSRRTRSINPLTSAISLLTNPPPPTSSSNPPYSLTRTTSPRTNNFNRRSRFSMSKPCPTLRTSFQESSQTSGSRRRQIPTQKCNLISHRRQYT